MTIELLVILVFVAVTAAVIGVFMLFSGRTQVRREKAIQNRLQEVGGAPTEAESVAGGAGTLLLKEIVSPMPKMDRAASAALKGSGIEKWLQQSGTAMTIGTVILTTLVFGSLAA